MTQAPTHAAKEEQYPGLSDKFHIVKPFILHKMLEMADAVKEKMHLLASYSPAIQFDILSFTILVLPMIPDRFAMDKW